jgi:phosphopentomutase
MKPTVGPPVRRVIVIVIDSAGIGELPDAGAYGDEGSNTIGNIASHVGLRVPTLRAMGLDRVVSLGAGRRETPQGAFGRMAERSPGKDSVTGHWELMGVVIDRAFPVFPNGFPREWIEEFERRIGRRTIGNVVASGTAIIEALGEEHLRTGAPIVYTSADSVFQIAAHEDVVPVPALYEMCERAFDLVSRGHGVGRVIARPFVGTPGTFSRTANRHDYALAPFGETLLDRLTARDWPVIAVGKIKDLFAGRGVSRSTPTRSDGARAIAPRPGHGQPRRLRHRVRPPQRSDGIRPQPRTHRCATGRVAAGTRRRRPAGRDRRSRQRSHDAEHRSLA